MKKNEVKQPWSEKVRCECEIVFWNMIEFKDLTDSTGLAETKGLTDSKELFETGDSIT